MEPSLTLQAPSQSTLPSTPSLSIDPTASFDSDTMSRYKQALADPSVNPQQALSEATQYQQQKNQISSSTASATASSQPSLLDEAGSWLKNNLSTVGSVAAPLIATALAPETGGLSLAALAAGGAALGNVGSQVANKENPLTAGSLESDAGQAALGGASEFGGQLIGGLLGKAGGAIGKLSTDEASRLATSATTGAVEPSLAAKTASLLSNVPADLIQQAYDRPTQVAAAMDGKVDTMGVLDQVRTALSNLSQKASSTYESSIDALAKGGASQYSIDMNPVKAQIPDILQKFGATMGTDINGQPFLKFDALSPITQTNDRKAIQTGISSILNNSQDDFQSINLLRRQMGDLIDHVTPGSEASNVLTNLKGAVNNQLVSSVPEMAGINATYSSQKGILDQLSGKMNGLNGEAALNNLLGANKTETQQLFSMLGGETGNDFVNTLKDIRAGKALSQIVPPTGARTLDIVRALGGFAAGGPIGAGAMAVASSPRVIGKLAIAAGNNAADRGGADVVSNILSKTAGGIGTALGAAGTPIGKGVIQGGIMGTANTIGNAMNPQAVPDTPTLPPQVSQTSAAPSLATQVPQTVNIPPLLKILGQSSPLAEQAIEAIGSGQQMTQNQYQALMEADLGRTNGHFQQAITAAYNAGNPTAVQGLGTAAGVLNQLQDLYNQAGGGGGLISGNIENALAPLTKGSANAYNQQKTALGQEIISQIYGSSGTSTDRDQILSLIPNLNDSPQNAATKMAGLRQLIQQRLSSMTGSTPTSVSSLDTSPSLAGVAP